MAAVGLGMVVGTAWMLGPGAAWWLGHVDDVHGLGGKDRAAALDAVRGRTLMIGAGLLLALAVVRTARNAGAVKLLGADLRGADLVGGTLTGACLADADLHEADLRDADLPDPDLSTGSNPARARQPTAPQPPQSPANPKPS